MLIDRLQNRGRIIDIRMSLVGSRDEVAVGAISMDTEPVSISLKAEKSRFISPK